MELITGSDSGKKLLFDSLERKPVSRAPWVPFAGIHAGKLKSYMAIEVLKDKRKLLESLLEVNRLYRPDGQPVLFDLQLEAEALGCELVWSDHNPPSVCSHPLKGNKEIPARILDESSGRIPMVLEVMKEMKREVGDRTALFGLICGPLTLASHLRGTDFFMDLIEDAEYTERLLSYTKDVCIAMTDIYVRAGRDVIAFVDPLVSQISPRHFQRSLLKVFGELFRHVKSCGVKSSFFVCGDATKNIELMCQTGTDSIFVDENIDLSSAKAITDRYDIVIGGNIPLTTTMLYGTQQDNIKYVVDLIEKLGTERYIVAPGCDMPYDIPIENAIAVQQTVSDMENAKRILENYEADDTDVNIELPDYKNLPRPLIEVFTLDSATCAACTYMMSVARLAIEEFGDLVEVVEYKSTVRENIARAKAMGVRNLPSIYINGKLKYSSVIPDRREFFGEIKRLIDS